MRNARTALAAVLVWAALAVGGAMAPVGPVAAACGGQTLDAVALNRVFSSPGIGADRDVPGYAGGDYQRSYPLPDGRVLWLFQDVFFSNDDVLLDSLTVAAHNAGLVQDGTCWRILGAPGRAYIGGDATEPMRRWFWPLDGAVGRDGRLWVFVAEMENPAATGAGRGTRPVATWIARIDVDTLEVVSLRRAPDDSPSLYGWSVVSDRRWSYLYAHCYRQFTEGTTAGVEQFDPSCMPDAHLARVPRGRFGATPEYWTGAGWSRRPSAARPVSTRGSANPMSVRRFGGVYVDVSKTDDWWGTWIHVSRAPTPMGPWEPVRSIWTVDLMRCSQCGIYHAQLHRRLVEGRMLVSTSNGAPYEIWYRDAGKYRPSFHTVDLPRYRRAADLTGRSARPIDRVRVLDSRESTRLRLGEVRTVGLPAAVAGTDGLVVRVTALAPRRPVQVRVWSCGTRPPTRATVSADSSTTTRTATVPFGDDERLCVATTARTHVVVEVAGTYAPR